MESAEQDPRRHVFRFDEHMADVDDLALIVLKGHLLIEEMLLELAALLVAHPDHLTRANLGFHKLACIDRALAKGEAGNKCWDLILGINSLRNQLAHKLEPPDLDRCVEEVLAADREAQPIDGMVFDKTGEDLDTNGGLRQAIVTCTQFLLGLIVRAETKP